MDTVARLHDAAMPNLGSYYTMVKENKPGLLEMGSSSIGPQFASCCTQMREHLRERHRITQINEHLNAAWAAMGDPSAIFYFGGRKWHEDGLQYKPIDVLGFIEALAKTAADIPLDVREKFDELCGVFCQMERAIAKVGN